MLSKVLPFKSGVGQSVALHAPAATRKSTLPVDITTLLYVQCTKCVYVCVGGGGGAWRGVTRISQ